MINVYRKPAKATAMYATRAFATWSWVATWAHGESRWSTVTASLGSSFSESLTEFLKRRRSWRQTGQLHNRCSTVCRTGGAGGEQAVQSGESSRLREWRKDAVRQHPARSRASWRTRERDPMRWRSEVGGLGNQRESQLLAISFVVNGN